MRHAPMSWGVPRDLYDSAQSRIADILLHSGQSLVACAEDDERHLYGCIVFHANAGWNVLHWCYTGSVYRGQGIARALFRAAKFTNKYSDTLILWSQPRHGWDPDSKNIEREKATLERYGLVPYPYVLYGIEPEDEELEPWQPPTSPPNEVA